MDYLREENRVLREQLGSQRLRFTDDQRRRLAAKAELVGRRGLADVARIATPDTLLARSSNGASGGSFPRHDEKDRSDDSRYERCSENPQFRDIQKARL